MSKRRLTLSAGTIALVVGALVVPAQSMAFPETDFVICTFSGATTSMTDIPGILGSNSQAHGDALDDALSAVPGNQAGETGVIIETGTFSFATAPSFMGIPTECVHVDVDGASGVDPDSSNDTGVVGATINSSGGYENVLCGTGTTTGNATLGTPADGEIASITFPYLIGFAAGNGTAVVILGLMNSQPGNPNPDRLARGSGTVHIEGKAAIQGGTACGDYDASDFNVFGSDTFWNMT